MTKTERIERLVHTAKVSIQHGLYKSAAQILREAAEIRSGKRG